MADDIYRNTDGVFTVRAWSDTTGAGNPRYRGRYWYRGHPASSQSAPDAAGACAAAAAVWTAYARGDFAAPAVRPGTLAAAAERWGAEGFLLGDHRLTALGNLCHLTSDACKKAGVTVVDFHGLRRSAGARWLQVGVPITTVSLWLGHRDIGTTVRHYAGIAETTSQTHMGLVDAAAEVPRVGVRRAQRSDSK